MDHYAELYEKEIGELIPLASIMSNEIFSKYFHNDTEELYKYCLENKQTWEEVLEVTLSSDPNVLY